jgi:RNA polymerase sigma-70 factor (ECF subfamily)
MSLSRDVDSRTEVDDVRRAAGGDTAAFERLYRAQVGRIHSLARRMVGEEDADDATQEIFIRAWNKLDTFRGDAAFGTWLHRLGINFLLGWRTSRARDRERFRQNEVALDTAPARRSDAALRLDFESAIGRLPDGAREVFVLHDIEGFKHREIARMLGVTEGTTKAQLHRARMALRQYLER